MCKKGEGMIYVTGVTCSGKTYLSKKIAEVIGYEHFSVGDWLRLVYPGEDHSGMSKREQEIRSRIFSANRNSIIDGFPRSKEQLLWLRANYLLDKGIIIYVHADFLTCLANAVTRNRKDIVSFQEAYNLQEQNLKGILEELHPNEYISVHQPIQSIYKFTNWVKNHLLAK